MIFDSMNSMNDNMMAKVSGVMVGIVTDNKDPEKLARVKVKLPVHDDDTATDWIRMTTLMSGKEQGTLFIPEVGDEVLVAFHMGDIREPFVIGSLWNKVEKPPEGNEKNNVRRIKSKSGHEITWNDEPDKGAIVIKTYSGQKLELEDQHQSVTIKDQSGQQVIRVDGHKNEIHINSNSTKITLKGNGDMEIQSVGSIKVSAPQLKLEASANMSISAGAALDIKCDGIVNIKGAMVKIN